ncbi:single-stranded DNA-binding protein [Vulcaniibacterium gelatinicum]|uniref:single-stranded DNA-binding protein n=1 Tax=Vulcaniibacterium gelatinicum TaxID=2598725 RepID=UPI0011C6EAB0|nr:single-stranded DNA-binding protein [Vulcaniibacterium gelatinicum]
MARGVNKVILVGNLGNDPDMKYTQGGMAICTLSVATTTVRKDRDGNTQEKTQWHRVKLFGRLGEIAGEYLRKGRQVYIEGSINYDKFTGQDGQERFVTEIIADEMQMLGGGEGGGRAEPRERPARPAAAPRREPAAARQESGVADDPFTDDDIPF